MTSIQLIYPFFKPKRDRSVFRFPPLGIGYIAASLQAAGYAPTVIDCTFLTKEEAIERALAQRCDITGVYAMVSMVDDALRFAQALRAHRALLVAGGPLPTCNPSTFLDHFDLAVIGEGEQTMVELVRAHEAGSDFADVAGLAYHAGDRLHTTAPRAFAADLDRIPFPARALLPNKSYIDYGRKKYGFSITTVMSTRGCPFQCEFCSNVVFGGSYRERSVARVVDEIEEALALGYDRISFGDDVFTMKRARVLAMCAEIERRNLRFSWECLGRVDALDYDVALAMKKAGCLRIFFGIESGDDDMLVLMRKEITTTQARTAVEAAHRAGLQVGAFFILFYPGDTGRTVLKTLRYAGSLPLDYLGLSMPYPLPGTALHARVKDRITRDWHPDESLLGSHVLLFNADFSEMKMWFGILKGHVVFALKRRLGRFAPPVVRAFDTITDIAFNLLR